MWIQENKFPEMEPHGYSGVTGHFYVVSLSAFTRQAGPLRDAVNHPYEDGVLDMRWWSLDEVEAPPDSGPCSRPVHSRASCGTCSTQTATGQ